MMEDVCIPQTSASRKLSLRRGGRLMPTMMEASKARPSPCFRFIAHGARGRGADIQTQHLYPVRVTSRAQIDS